MEQGDGKMQELIDKGQCPNCRVRLQDGKCGVCNLRMVERCPDCGGDGTYLHEGYEYSYKAGTHRYIAECAACNGTGEIDGRSEESDEGGGFPWEDLWRGAQ